MTGALYALFAWALFSSVARADGRPPLSVGELKRHFFDDTDRYFSSIGESVEVTGVIAELERCAREPCAAPSHFVLTSGKGGPRLEVCGLPAGGGGPRRGQQVRVRGKLGRHVGGCPEKGTFGVLMHEETLDARGGGILLAGGSSMANQEQPTDAQLREAVKAGDTAKASALVDQGADLESRAYAGGATPLGYAADSGDVGMIQLLLKRGAKIEATGDRGRTPLLVAVVGGKSQAVDALLAAGANPNAVDHDGKPALVLAADQGSAEVARKLLAKGADKNARVVSGPMAKATALINALESRHSSVALALIEAGADVNAVGSVGETPLHSCSDNPREVCSALLDHGAILEAKMPDGNTPLMAAAQEGNAPVVQLLLDKGADPNLKNVRGETALKLAEQGGHQAAVDVLKPRTIIR